MMLALLLLGMLALTFNIQPVKASGTIYIRADGSVDPDTAPISSVDNITYTLTDNIVGDVQPTSIAIVVERDDIIIDGAGYTLQGTGAYLSKGIDLTGRTNVRVQNTQIKNFDYGIGLYRSSNNSISENNIAHNGYGISLSSSNYSVVSGNTFTNNGLIVWDSYQNVVEDNTVNRKPLVYLEGAADYTVDDAGQVILINCTGIRVENLNLSQTSIGVQLWETSNSSIADNTIANNRDGIGLRSSSNNGVSGNNITANNGNSIYLWHSSNYNSISGNNITANSFYGIWLDFSSNYNSISGNNITANSFYGIWLDFSSNNTVSGNNIEGNNEDGILLSFRTNNNSICGNNITDNGNGIYLSAPSNYNSVSGNNITANSDTGVYVRYCDYNTISGNQIVDNGNGIFLENSSNITINGNTITKNDIGIKLDELRAYAHNRIYHNNFIVNTQQVNMVAPSRTNFWDDTVEGNYWSNYTGVDSNHDGIGDSPHIIDANNTDNYPLMGTFNSYNVTYYTLPLVPHACDVTVISNSTISDFVAPIWIEHPEVTSLMFNASGAEGSTGFCRVSFPTAMMNGTYHVSVNGTEIPYTLLPCSDANYSYLYFTYTHPTETVIIIPEFPTWTSMLLVLIILTVTMVICKRRPLKTPIH